MTSKKVIRLKLYEATSNGKCAICQESFGYRDERNISFIDVHHQTCKTMTISRACAYGYKTALEEYTRGDCVWVHHECHMILHDEKGQHCVRV